MKSKHQLLLSLSTLVWLAGCYETTDAGMGEDPRTGAGSGNLLKNAGFEDGVADPWEQWGSFSVDDDGQARSGDFAARVADNNGGGQFVSVFAGRPYRYSAWGKVSGGGGSAVLTLKFWGEQGQIATELVSDAFSSEYAERAISTTVPPGATEVQIGFYNSSSGALYLDDVALVDESEDESEATDLLRNGDFESASIEHWQPWGTFTTSSDNAHGGEHAARVPSQNGGGQFVDVIPGQTYTFTAWGDAQGGGGTASLIYKFFDAAWQQVGPEEVASTFVPGYEQRSISREAPASAVRLQVGFWNASDADLFLDDMSLVEGGASGTGPEPGGGEPGDEPGDDPGGPEPGGDPQPCPAGSPPGAVANQLVSPGQPVVVPPDFVGMHVSPNDAYTGNAVPAPSYDYGYTRSLGVGTGAALTEMNFWAKIEKSERPEGEPGDFDWSAVDTWVEANEGHPIIWLIYGTPTFYQKYGDQNDTFWGGNITRGMHNPPRDDAHYALKRFAQAVKARYGSQIAAFEVWNEPTLSYGDAGNYTKRCDPSITDPNICPAQRFFSGNATDLANIAFTLSSADLGVPILGAGIVDQWQAEAHTVSRFLDAPVTVAGGDGTGKDHIQALSVHFYDYGYNPAALRQHIEGYRAKLAGSGVGDMPIWITESGAEASGAFEANDVRAPVNIRRWTAISAAMGAQSHVLYTHAVPADSVRTLGDPVYNPAVQDAVSDSHALGGRTICEASILTNGRVWLLTDAGEIIR